MVNQMAMIHMREDRRCQGSGQVQNPQVQNPVSLFPPEFLRIPLRGTDAGQTWPANTEWDEFGGSVPGRHHGHRVTCLPSRLLNLLQVVGFQEWDCGMGCPGADRNRNPTRNHSVDDYGDDYGGRIRNFPRYP
jgi:hypothetical protein